MFPNRYTTLICAILMGMLWVIPGTSTAQDNTQTGRFKVEELPGMVDREDEIRAGLLYDAVTQTVVWEKDMHYAYPIASLTKMMVALITVEAIRDSLVDWSDEVVVERLYKKSRRSRSVYKTTETYTLESLLQLAMIPSNNLACSDIAKYLSGDVPTFVQRMNDRAYALGMKNTNYSNPSGLPGTVKEIDNSSSPHDLLLLSLELLKYDDLLKITSTGYAEVTNDKRSGVYKNHNHLVIDYENEVDGLKTGFTKRAKFCLAASARKDDYRMISIVLGVSNPYLRNDIVADMLNHYYSRIGCGPMISSTRGPVAAPDLVNEDLIPDNDSSVVYRTVWTKKKKTHTVRGGETLSYLADKYNVTYQQIKKWNRLSTNRIMVGQKLLVYVNTPVQIAIRNTPETDNEDETSQEEEAGLVETLGSESVAAQTSNGSDNETATPAGSNPAKAPVAKSVKAAQPKTAATASSSEKTTTSASNVRKYVYHTVQPGDTLWSIGQRYETTVDEIKRANGIYNARSLKPGTKLKIKVNG
jgi:D-alanyl-D-alanine carboxypeptidase